LHHASCISSPSCLRHGLIWCSSPCCAGPVVHAKVAREREVEQLNTPCTSLKPAQPPGTAVRAIHTSAYHRLLVHFKDCDQCNLVPVAGLEGPLLSCSRPSAYAECGLLGKASRFRSRTGGGTPRHRACFSALVSCTAPRIARFCRFDFKFESNVK
jgi:hypothetical protein